MIDEQQQHQQQTDTNLVDKAIDVIVQNGNLIRTRITLLAAEEEEVKKKSIIFPILYLPTEYFSITNIKDFISKEWKIPPQEQRIYYNDVTSDGGLSELFHDTASSKMLLLTDIIMMRGNGATGGGCGGLVLGGGGGGELNLVVRQIPLRPQLESLFELVGLEDWKERDEIMAKLSLHRNYTHSRRCYFEHELIPLSPQEEEEEEEEEKFCIKCHKPTKHNSYWVCKNSTSTSTSSSGNVHHCFCSSFVLCNRCYQYDNDRLYSGIAQLFGGPRDALERIAQDVGRNIIYQNLKLLKNNKKKKVTIKVPNDFEFAPKSLIHPGLNIGPDDKVLPNGITIQYQYKLNNSANNTSEGTTEILLLSSQVLEHGMTQKGLFESNHQMISLLLKQQQRQEPPLFNNNTRIKLRSYQVGKVVLEIVSC